MSKYLLSIAILLAMLGNLPQANAYQTHVDSLLSSLESDLRPYTDSEIELIQTEAKNACSNAIRGLSQTAVGFALAHDLKLSKLLDLLHSPSPDQVELRLFENRLRRIIPGQNQQYLDDVKTRVSQLRRVLASDSQSITRARQAIANLRLINSKRELTSSDQTQLQVDFASLYEVALEPQQLTILQKTLSVPNVQTYLKTHTFEQLGQTSFSIPLQFSQCKDKTEIDANGSARVSLLPNFGVSEESIPLKMFVNGQGSLQVAARRKPAELWVDVSVNLRGQQPVRLNPTDIQRESPAVQAKLSSQVRDIRLEGHLDKIRLLRNILARAVQRKLSEQDPMLSRSIEQTIAARAEEEGYKLAFKVNRLLTLSLWNRLQSVDFTPDITLSANESYLTSQALYAFPDQLGALTSPPRIPETLSDQLTWTTHIHESAVNNILGKLIGFSLDEATMRGIWQVQLKLTTSEWETPTAASVPSTIIFSDERPIELQVRDHRLVAILRMKSGMLASQKTHLPPATVELIYSLSSGANGFSILRDPITLPSELSAEDKASWLSVLERFFPASVQPIPKFRPSMWENYVSLRYLSAQQGWLSIGLTSLGKETAAAISVANKQLAGESIPFRGVQK